MGEKNIETILKRFSVQATAHRVAVLDVIRSAERPIDGQAVFERLRASGSSIDRATVFRAMKTFEEAGLLRPLEFNEGKVRYELDLDSHHHHLICTECGAIQCLQECNLKEAEEKIRRMTGFISRFHRLDFFGTCRKCADKQS